jgi:hypothetical protein
VKVAIRLGGLGNTNHSSMECEITVRNRCHAYLVGVSFVVRDGEGHQIVERRST